MSEKNGPAQHTTEPSRKAHDDPDPDQPAGVLGASMVGTAATVVVSAGLALLDSPSSVGSAVGFAIFALPFAWVVWLNGIVFLGLPVWALLENRIANRRFAAAAAGAVLVGGVWGWFGTMFGAALDLGLSGALCGAAAGVMFEGAAYRGWCIYKAIKDA